MRSLTILLKLTFILFTLIDSTVFGQGTYSSTTIYTPNFTPVTAGILTSADLTTTEKNDLRDGWLEYYDNRITFLTEATKTYNCHAFAWRVSEGGTNVWLNSPGDDAFWNDDSYIEVPNQSEATKVSFGSVDHSAITTSTTDIFISKWGYSPRFRHDVDDCPYNSQDLHYYVRPYITGSDNVCSYAAEYIVNDLPSGATISWACSANITLVSNQGSSPAEFESNNNGEGWIGATITYNSEQYELGKKYVWSGNPIAPTSIYSYQDPPCVDHGDFYFNNPGNSFLTGYHWYVESEYYSALYAYGMSASVLVQVPQYITLSVNAENQCGFSDMYYTDPIYLDYCEYKMVLSPNPATDRLKIELPDNSTGIATMEINNSQGVRVISTTITGTEKTIDISRLPKGLYYITVFNNSKGKSKINTERFIKE